MTKDPVCGMKLDEKKSLKTKYKDRVYYFCSSNCESTFKENPEKFINKT
ncbi:YHS domain-containing protein [Candidatus Pacearchaeota archaeon]|nr:YHS domain-containing protein [Candidatus Pacearchaeota archaeon]